MTTRRRLIGAGAVAVAASAALVWAATRLEPRLRTAAERALAAHLDSTVTLERLDLRLWPSPAVAGGGLVVRHRGRADLPPLLAVRAFEGRISWPGLRSMPTAASRGLSTASPPLARRRRRTSASRSSARRRCRYGRRFARSWMAPAVTSCSSRWR